MKILTCVLGVLAVGMLVFAGIMLVPLTDGGGDPSVSPSAQPIEPTQSVGGAKLTLYEGPKTYKTSESVKITADGNDLFVYDAAVNPSRTNRGDYSVSSVVTTPMTYFDFEGRVVIEVELSAGSDIAEITSATLSPVTKNIPVKITESLNSAGESIANPRVSFELTEPGQYTLQFNGKGTGAVHIFANAIETDIPSRDDPNVLWVDPGEWTVEDGIQLKTGQTLYISGGAVIHTTVSANYAENVTIRGRGIIDGGIWESWKGNNAKVPVDFRYCKNARAEGFIINNSNAWCFNAFETENSVAENVKIISARPNGDGFTLQSCRNFTVKDSFSRTWDDSLVVKNYEGNTDNILFKNVQVWTDLAQSCEIGYETNKGKKPDSKITNVTFEDINVINAYHKPVLSIHNSDDALVDSVVYKNITVENAAMGGGDAESNKQLIDINIAGSGWSATRERGTVRNVSFENITVLAAPDMTMLPQVHINGYDETHDVQNVSIKNLVIFGQKINSLEDLKVRGQYSANITLE